MANKSFTLSDFDITTQEIINGFLYITNNDPLFNDLFFILKVGLNDMPLFPNIRLNDNASFMDYLKKWINGYKEATVNPPSKRHASPKGSCSDPAIQTIVKIARNIDSNLAKQMAAYHNLFMSAENIQGNLLEEYISLSIRPYGWIWCNGNTLHAIDFCSSDGAILLQIKNKSNTENSSSSAIRAGTDIKKWFRLATQSINGIKHPSYKWDSLNDIINSHITKDSHSHCNMNEEAYQKFLKAVTSNNVHIISDK